MGCVKNAVFALTMETVLAWPSTGVGYIQVGVGVFAECRKGAVSRLVSGVVLITLVCWLGVVILLLLG